MQFQGPLQGQLGCVSQLVSTAMQTHITNSGDTILLRPAMLLMAMTEQLGT